jgi:hypothetical protein
MDISPSCILKGCDARFVNGLVARAFKGQNVKVDIHNKATTIVNSYDIKDCMKIITTYGDLQDVFMKLQLNPGVLESISGNKLKFHRYAAFIYVEKVIDTKVKVKLDAFRVKAGIASGQCDMTCSICLAEIAACDAKITRCNHAFHRACINQWGRDTCPMCRGNI